jgi:transposase-like protein
VHKTGTRYSEAFKQQVVDAIAKGKYTSAHEAYVACGIGSVETVRRWLKKYGRDDLLPKRIRIETLKEVDRLKAANKRIKELEAALADSHIDNCLEHAFLEIACERMDEDISDFKKKNALTLSDVRKMRGHK